jgi:hypothetical protein
MGRINGVHRMPKHAAFRHLPIFHYTSDDADDTDSIWLGSGSGDFSDGYNRDGRVYCHKSGLQYVVEIFSKVFVRLMRL